VFGTSVYKLKMWRKEKKKVEEEEEEEGGKRKGVGE